MFDWENAIALHAKQGIGPHLVAMGKSHGFSRVVAGTWGIFSSYHTYTHTSFHEPICSGPLESESPRCDR